MRLALAQNVEEKWLLCGTEIEEVNFIYVSVVDRNIKESGLFTLSFSITRSAKL